MAVTCSFTVARVMPSLRAMASLACPSSMKWAISVSRSVRPRRRGAAARSSVGELRTGVDHRRAHVPVPQQLLAPCGYRGRRPRSQAPLGQVAYEAGACERILTILSSRLGGERVGVALKFRKP